MHSKCNHNPKVPRSSSKRKKDSKHISISFVLTPFFEDNRCAFLQWARQERVRLACFSSLSFSRINPKALAQGVDGEAYFRNIGPNVGRVRKKRLKSSTGQRRDFLLLILEFESQKDWVQDSRLGKESCERKDKTSTIRGKAVLKRRRSRMSIWGKAFRLRSSL